MWNVALTLALLFTIAAKSKTIETFDFVDIDGRESRSYLFVPDGCTSESPCPAWQVNPDWSGLDEYEWTRACMISDMGYVAYIPDVYGVDTSSYEHVGTPVYEHLHRVEPGPYNGLINHVAVDREGYMQKISNGFDFLSSRPEVIADKIVTNGYCFGGIAVLDAMHANIPFKAGFGNHPNIFAFDAGLEENMQIDARVVSLSGTLDFADDYVFDPVLTAGIGTGAIDWWNSLERESASWQQNRYSGIGHFFTNFDFAIDPNPDDPDGPNHYDPTADLRSWRLQNFTTRTLFGEIGAEPMPIYPSLDQSIYHVESFTIDADNGMKMYPKSCTAENQCPAVVVLPDSYSYDFALSKTEEIAMEGYIGITADLAAMYINRPEEDVIASIESVARHAGSMENHNGKIIVIGYDKAASLLLRYSQYDAMPLDGMVLFGGEYFDRPSFRAGTLDTPFVIHHGYKDQFERNDFPGLETALEQAGGSYEIVFYGSHVGGRFYDPSRYECSKELEDFKGNEERYECYDADADYYSWGQAKLFFEEIFEDLKPVPGPESECPGDFATLTSPAFPQAEEPEESCEDDPEWANGRGLTCADVYESYVSLDKVCTSNGLLTNCCAMCAMLEMRTTQDVEEFNLCPEGMMYNAEAYFLPVGASEGMEALCENAARYCARDAECDTAFFATTDCCYSDSAEESTEGPSESTEGPSTCGCGEEIGSAFSNLEEQLQTQMAALMTERLPAELETLLSERLQAALTAALPDNFVTAEDFAMLQDKVGDLEMDNNDVMNGMSDMATCMADIAGSMGGDRGDDSYEETDAPAVETAAPTEYWETIGRLMEGGNNKCSTSDADRAFRLSFTSLENCLTRCSNDARCQFASTNFMSDSSTKYCIGCINLTQAADGWMAYEMLNDRRQLSSVKQLSEVERLRAENQRLRAELAEARRN